MTTVIQALAAAADDVRAVRKTDVNSHQKFHFRGIDAVLNAVGPAFRSHGIVCLPVTEDVSLDTVMTTGGKPSTRALVKVRYRFHGPAGDSVDAVVTGEAWDTGDKATAKAYSVAYRTALLQTLTIPTDDPDPDSSTFVRTEPDVPMAAESALFTLREALVALYENDPEGKQRYNDWRLHNGIPSLNGPITVEQYQMVSEWISAH